MNRRLFGIETEYGLVAAGASPRARDDCLLTLLDRMKASVPSMLDQFGHGVFLCNGARFYLDCGHPELTTPECDNPWDAVRYVVAGERLLRRLADQCAAAGHPLVLFRSQVDYSGSGATWGCHESYMHHGRHRSFPENLIPHLVSRIVFTGAGGFDNRAAGIEFLISPRVTHLTQATSDSSTGDRGIFHTKDEPLAGGEYGRLHLLCGESLCSELSTWLKVGTTALVVALIDAGHCPGEAVRLRDPVTAMQRFARDPSCTARVRTESGAAMGAIEIQRRYLAEVQAHAHQPWMPAWAAKVCERWSAVLDLLERGPEAAAGSLDWALKLSLFRGHLLRQGLVWESLPALNRTATRLCPPPAISQRAATAQASLPLLPPEIARLHQVRQELFELDTRFGQLDDTGLFPQLDARGLLDHHVPGVDNVEQAILNPPDSGRALVRGRTIAALATEGERYIADWQSIWDVHERRVVDLSDPFAESGEWQPMAALDRLFMRAGRRLHEPLAAILAGRRRRARQDREAELQPGAPGSSNPV